MIPVSYKSISQVTGPLLFVEKVKDAAYGEIVEITNALGERLRGQVLDTREDLAIVQVFGSTIGLDTKSTSVKFLGETLRISVSDEMLGRIFDGIGNPRDNGPPIISKHKVDIVGSGINPYAREEPSEFIQTGISGIDGMNTLVRGQKLPIFSGSGLPHNTLAAQIARQAKVLTTSESFYVVFAAIGITSEEANFFIREFQETGSLERTVLFLNLSSDPSMERIHTPRLALTTAEFLAYELESH
ncbi:MAG: V-type ATP synthase subunit B, partial [Thermoproteota archaeon]